MDIDTSPGAVHEVDPEDPLLPIIWPFRVRKIEFVGPDRLEEWQRLMREEVRAQPAGGSTGGGEMARPGCETISGSGDGWDDCDYWGRGC